MNDKMNKLLDDIITDIIDNGTTNFKTNPIETIVHEELFSKLCKSEITVEEANEALESTTKLLYYINKLTPAPEGPESFRNKSLRISASIRSRIKSIYYTINRKSSPNITLFDMMAKSIILEELSANNLVDEAFMKITDDIRLYYKGELEKKRDSSMDLSIEDAEDIITRISAPQYISVNRNGASFNIRDESSIHIYDDDNTDID